MFEIPIYDDSNQKRIQQRCRTGDNKCVPISKARGGGDPGFLDRGFKFIKGGGVGLDLLILPDYLLIFSDILKILHENEIILSQMNPLWIRH